MSSIQLYFLIKLNAIISLAWIGFLVFFLLPFLLMFIVWAGEEQGKEVKFRSVIRKVKWMFWLSLMFIPVAVMVPSTKEMAVIYVVPKVVNSKPIKKLPKKLLLLSSEWLDELRPEKIKESGKTIVQQSLTGSEDSAQISGETSVSE